MIVGFDVKPLFKTEYLYREISSLGAEKLYGRSEEKKIT
jgi:hypothetical protein